MDQRDKDKLLQKYLRSYKKHHRTREEEKKLEEEARTRRQNRRRRGARRSRDDEEDFEKIGRSPRFHRRTAPTQNEEAALRARPPSAPQADPVDATRESGRLVTGVVSAVHRDGVRVLHAGEEFVVRYGTAPETRTLAAGDEVEIEPLEGGHWRIRLRRPRRTVLSRPDPAGGHKERVLAANIDLAVLVSSARSPAFRPALIDRLLLAVARGGVRPVLCINKFDLVPVERRSEFDADCADWREQGHSIHFVSAATGLGLSDLAGELSGKTCVFLGHSGVGKSSLSNALDPSHARATSHVRSADGKGRHTTTSSGLWTLRDGTRLIDTPGIRSFGLWDIDRAALEEAFPDVLVWAARCRFRDCRHGPEPDCGVRAALASGALRTARWRRFARLTAELDSDSGPSLA